MRIEWAIPCTSATVTDDGRVSGIEDFGFDTIEVDPFPSAVEFIALIRAAGLPDDFREAADRRVDAYLLGPGMDPLLSIPFELPHGEPGPGYKAGWELNATIPLVIQFTPHAVGTHSLELYVHTRHQNRSIFIQIEAPHDS